MLKKDKLRYNEYFNMQSIFDELYQQSRNNNNFYKLIEVIGSKQNIRLAYRNLKGNTGSKTKGTDGKTIEDISKLNDEMLIKEVRARLEDYNPLPVRRVYIPKPGSDKKRPLGIPTIWDRQKIFDIQKHTVAESVKKYNSAVTGIQNYYRIATNVYNNLDEINFSLLRTHNNRLSKKAKIVRFGETPSDFKKKTTGIRDCKKIYRIMDVYMLPITGVHHKSPMNFSQEICNYTEKGRKKIHNNQKVVASTTLRAFQLNLNENDTIEFRNNMISKYVAQYGKCYITGTELNPENAIGIRIKPKERNGTDDYSNIVIVDKAVIPLIEDIDIDYCSNLTEKQRVKLNKLRKARKLKPVSGTCKLA